jgi:hypothetical protein
MQTSINHRKFDGGSVIFAAGHFRTLLNMVTTLTLTLNPSDYTVIIVIKSDSVRKWPATEFFIRIALHDLKIKRVENCSRSPQSTRFKDSFWQNKELPL